MPQNILMITAIAGAENCAAVAVQAIWLDGRNRRAAARKGLPHCDAANSRPGRADESLDRLRTMERTRSSKHAGLAIPLEINFAISGCGAWFAKCAPRCFAATGSRTWPCAAATSSIQSELRDALAGLLLQSQLALAEPVLASVVREG